MQPYALDKSFFVGRLDTDLDDPEFYFRSTIADVDFGATQMALYTPVASSVSRVHWEITEDLLLARLAYDRIDNSTTTTDVVILRCSIRLSASAANVSRDTVTGPRVITSDGTNDSTSA